MMKNMRRGIPNLFKDGTKHRSGLDEAVLRNIDACKSLADLTRTSLGPNGMNKMVINHLDKIFVTSDTATLMNEMEIAHPAAKLIVMAAAMQESEIGDGSNLVISLAGELLVQAGELLNMGLHPSEIVQGYTKASKKCFELMETLSIDLVEGAGLFTREQLMKAVLGPMATKQYGYEQVLAPLVVDACLAVIPRNAFNFQVDNVRVVKVLGGNLHQSEVIKGIVLGHDSIGSIKRVENAKVAVFTCSISSPETETKGTILIHDAKELMSYNDSEEREIEAIIKSLHASGVRVVVTGSTIDDISQHFLEKYGMMAVKTPSKFELRRICRATRARPLVQLGPVRAEDIGFAAHVFVREVGGSKVTVFQQEQSDHSNVATILLRASTHNILNDLERAIDDGVNTVRALTRDGRLVAGAGAFEMELAVKLQEFASKAPGLEQYALNKFAMSMEVVPRAIAENAGFSAMDVLSQLYAAHQKGNALAGVDIESGGAKDLASGPSPVLDLLILKKQAFKLAIDAVLTILRIDSIIMAKPAGGPKVGGGQGGHWDEDD